MRTAAASATTSDGRPLDAGYVQRQFQAALKAAGLPGQPFHALRHARATLLLEQGEELGVVSRILGRSNIATPFGSSTASIRSAALADNLRVKRA